MKQLTLPQVQEWARQSIDRMIALSVEVNPRAVYNIIQQSYPDQFQHLEPGYEKQMFMRTKMIKFLSDKAKQHSNPGTYIQALLQSVELPQTEEAENAIYHLINSNRY